MGYMLNWNSPDQQSLNKNTVIVIFWTVLSTLQNMVLRQLIVQEWDNYASPNPLFHLPD